MSVGNTPIDDNARQVMAWDATNHRPAVPQIVSTSVDNGVTYGAISINGSISATNPSVSATGAAVPASATYLGANKSGNITGLSLDGSGYLNVNVQTGGGSNASVGTDGSAIPTSSTMIGASDGTNLQQLLVESSSNRNLRTGIYSGANEATVTGANALKVDNSAVTQPISAASLPLPTGASTSAKQPALGTAGSASSDVLSVQGIASMTALKVDGSGVTQPVSGTFWQATQPVSGTVTSNAGTNLNTSLLALEAGGNLATLVTNTADLLADGDNLATINTNTANIGASGDAAVVGDTTGSLSAKLRGLSKIINDMWDSTNHWLQVKVMNANANGQATMANSAPVALASDQGAILIKQGVGAAAGTNWRVAPDFTEQASLTAASLNADLVPSTDISAYEEWSIQVSAIATGGTLTFQGSNDNSTFVSALAYPVSNTGSPTTAVSAAGVWCGPRRYRYLRIRQTAWTSGTTTGTFEAYTSANYQTTQSTNANATQTGTWTVQPGNTQNTTPWLMVGPNANGTQAANTAANTVIKGSAGWLFHAIVTTLGTAGLTIYDNASTNSGTPLLVIPASAAVGTIYSFPSGARAVNGITSAGVTNCPAVTFHYT